MGMLRANTLVLFIGSVLIHRWKQFNKYHYFTSTIDFYYISDLNETEFIAAFTSSLVAVGFHSGTPTLYP